jgi:hypothetical protein
MQVSPQELEEFITKAKKATYASKGEGQTEADGSKTLQFKDGEFTYRDKYFGSYGFGGEEVVWFKEKPVWVMNYYGRIEKRIIDPETIFVFLRRALLKIHPKRPFRGPNHYEEADFEYTNSNIGDITRFIGTEQIAYKGETVYKLEYHGGATRDNE